MRVSRRLAALLTLIALVAPAGAALAHGPGGQERGAQMEQELGLTPDQAAQVRAIMKEQGEKRRALWKESSDRAAIPGQIRALDDETRQRLAAILNEEQMAKVDQRMQDRRGTDAEGGVSGDRGKFVAESLGLDAGQQDAVKKIFEDTNSRREAIMKSSGTREDKHKQILALHEGVREKMAGILSAEQMAKFDEMHERHMKRMESRKPGPREHRKRDHGPSGESADTTPAQ